MGALFVYCLSMIFDLHSHTTLSDGLLTPGELIARAVEKQVDVLAITDHDTTDAYQELPDGLDQIRLIPGIEFSTQWEGKGIHILGLNIELDCDALPTCEAKNASCTVDDECCSGDCKGNGRCR